MQRFSYITKRSLKNHNSYCSNKTVNGIYSTPNGVSQMTIVYENIISGGIPSPSFAATYYVGSDACVSSPCSNGSTCVNTMGGYFCQCMAGYVGVNCKQCECIYYKILTVPEMTWKDHDPYPLWLWIERCLTPECWLRNCDHLTLLHAGLCNKDTCQNNGTCIDTYALPDLSNVTAIDFTQNFDFSCQCPQATTGRRCETLIIKGRDDSVTCPSGWTLNSNNCYYLGTDLVDEPTSESQCKSSGSLGALLASVHSDSERDLISQW
uniref:EGF-like domain-containing protein n=1 Tax=Romanomermis culicivorax TaxID=13658 RepID=A0A915JHT3_ROMCU